MKRVLFVTFLSVTCPLFAKRSAEIWRLLWSVGGSFLSWKGQEVKDTDDESLNCGCMQFQQWIKSKSNLNKKTVLSQRWPRNVRYISRSWPVAEIWPFEIIQDGGGRHLEFIRIENSTIRSAGPENPTLEQNMKWIGSAVAEIWPFAYVGRIWNPIWGKGRS